MAGVSTRKNCARPASHRDAQLADLSAFHVPTLLIAGGEEHRVSGFPGRCDRRRLATWRGSDDHLFRALALL